MSPGAPAESKRAILETRPSGESPKAEERNPEDEPHQHRPDSADPLP